MLKQNKQIVFSPSDLVAFTACRTRTAFDLAAVHDLAQSVVNKFGIGAFRPAGDSAAAEAMQQHGMRHEKAYLDHLKSQYKTVEEIDRKDPIAATRDAIASNADVIFQAKLHVDDFAGYADFLIKAPDSGSQGPAYYNIADTKLARSNRAKFMLQLGLYADLLQTVQKRLPEKLIVVLGASGTDKAWNEQNHSTHDYIHYTRAIKARFKAFARDPSQAIAQADPVPIAACDLCRWRETCAEIWAKRDDLSLIANIRRSQINALKAANIDTRQALVADAQVIKGIGAPVLTKLRDQAALQLKVEALKAGEERPRKILDPVDPSKPSGLALLPLPDAGDLYFDMEGYPYEPGGLEYLFGLGWRADATAPVGPLSNAYLREQFQFRAFWAHDRAEEKAAFEAFMDFVSEHLKKFPDAHIYHYAAYENTALKRLAGVHDTRSGELDRLLKERRLVDLYRVVASGLLLGLPSYSIKKVEAYYRDGGRTTEVANGGDSILEYERFRLSETDVDKQKILQDLHDYNRDDVLSTLELHNWLEHIRPDDVPRYNARVPGPPEDQAGAAMENGEAAENKKAEELAAARDSARTALKNWRAGVGETDLDVTRTAELLDHLLDFYWRCRLPSIWRSYRRQETPEPELLDDPDCLALLTRIGEPNAENLSFRHSYQVPDQETTLKTGDTVKCLKDGGTAANFIFQPDIGVASFTRRKNASKPHDTLTLVANKYLSTDIKLHSICRFIMSLPGTFDGALARLLRRDLPRLTGRVTGAPIVTAPTVEQVIAAVAALDRSYLVIQGPPGTGKTTMAAAVIAALLQQGRRVGITSNSHAVIDNLLIRAVQRCQEACVAVDAAKALSNEGDEDQQERLKESLIRIVKPTHTPGPHTLLGGTSWVFSRQDHTGYWDYLFVDEASQVSMADIVAVGASARNIVLLGDQMQLPQPIEGVHPGDSGLSVLEYIMGSRMTVPDDAGIFLGLTHRMHPDVCKPISNGVYEARLRSAAETAKQRLVLGKHAEPALRPTGVIYVPAAHSGCGRSAPAECDRIQDLYQNLLGQEWIDRQGHRHRMTAGDILVVAPYNAQVRLLREILGSGARVGTVDKFQGQEAAVCIVSMTSSDGEEMPRGIDFLFSRNRLNVAVSRAKCLSIIVGSPGLEAMACETVEDMVRLNFYESLMCDRGS